MLKYVGTDIMCQEVPDEISLAIDLSCCPIRCSGCHSPYLWQDCGDVLDEESLGKEIGKYLGDITCVCFLGGDNDARGIEELARWIVANYKGELSVAWYSGRSKAPKGMDLSLLKYIKLGPYVEELGPLSKKTTNQRFYRVATDGQLEDITYMFWQNQKELV